MATNRQIFDFSLRFLHMLRSDDTPYTALVDPSLGDAFTELGFAMDSGKAFENAFGHAARDPLRRGLGSARFMTAAPQTAQPGPIGEAIRRLGEVLDGAMIPLHEDSFCMKQRKIKKQPPTQAGRGLLFVSLRRRWSRSHPRCSRR